MPTCTCQHVYACKCISVLIVPSTMCCVRAKHESVSGTQADFTLILSLSPAPELVLRKVINFADCTVCLDKRNASGKIEFYQDPLLYKCSFRTRLHFTYDNINSKIPAVIKVRTPKKNNNNNSRYNTHNN